MSNNYGLTNSEVLDLQIWSRVQKRVIQFQNKATPMIFDEIFGTEFGSKLFEHFKIRCNSDYQKFNTFLDVDQHNRVLAHIITSPYYNP